ncbi:MAG: hypothetical protein JXQ29_08890 [Planctomycetes bacterium]|nr:hypothetical protein [Planctomycetota bacterium]
MTKHVGDHDDRVAGGADGHSWTEAGAPTEGTVAAPAAEIAAGGTEPSGVRVSLGKGLDVGTANLVSAVQNEAGGITIKMERNAFIDIRQDVHSKNLLTKLKVPYVIHNNTMIVLGDEAFQLANIFNRTTRRPMRDGMLSPAEVDAMTMIRLIIEKVLGQPQNPGEVCFFSVPGEPIDSTANVIYHQGVFEGLLQKLGYTPRAMNEGHAVVFSELADQDFSGIGISCGGGMFNICVAFKSIPALTFSTTRGGDWIDKNVAAVLGIPVSKATYIKEQEMDLTRPKGREQEAVCIYYRNLINYTLTNIKSRFLGSAGMPEFPEPIDIVCAGGTSSPHGFIEVFQDEFKKLDFPIKIKAIRRAEDPLTSVAKGCLVAAALSE